MPKIRHEAVVEILQNEPKLVLSLLAYSGMHLRFGSQVGATIADSNLSNRDADDDDYFRGLFSDNVFVFEGDGHRVAVIAEVQSGRPDEERSLSWPAYIANARRRHRCDSLLMVFAITKDAARGSAKPIRTGHPRWDLVPLISGVGRTPGTPAAGGRFCAELVLLRIVTRELTLNTHDARMFALAAVRSAPPERIARYTGYLKALAPRSVREPLETLMKTVFKDTFVDGLLDQGHLRGVRQMMLQLLDKRFSVPEDIRKQVEECTDIAKIDAWFDRAITATSLEEIFVELRVVWISFSLPPRNRIPCGMTMAPMPLSSRTARTCWANMRSAFLPVSGAQPKSKRSLYRIPSWVVVQGEWRVGEYTVEAVSSPLGSMCFGVVSVSSFCRSALLIPCSTMCSRRCSTM